jgi:hypothetical protein
MVQGLVSGSWQLFLTVAGMIAVITSVLAGASAAVLVAVVPLEQGGGARRAANAGEAREPLLGAAGQRGTPSYEQPIRPHVWHIRRWTQRPPIARHSSQPMISSGRSTTRIWSA